MMQPGEFVKSMVTTTPADLSSSEAIEIKKSIRRFPEEAIYVYSFKEGKMLYAEGWFEVLGYKDDEISMLELISITTPQYAQFSFELNDKALKFIWSKTEDLEKYSFSIEIKKRHKLGHEVPLIVSVGVFKSEKGVVTEIIGRNQINHSIALGKVMRYAAYGPDRVEFEEELNKQIFSDFAISRKEKEALTYVAKGLALKEIAQVLNVSQSAIEKRILPLYKRFDVKSLSSLISFAYENHILP